MARSDTAKDARPASLRSAVADNVSLSNRVAGLAVTVPGAAHVIYYTDDLGSVREDMLQGFFVGWPRQPSAGQHLAVLRGSYRAVVAIDDADDRVAGFVNMLSDGVLTAFIPWLEVLPGYQGGGIGGELMRRILEGTDRFYSVDLVCDAALVPYYARFGMAGASSALLRHPAALDGCPPAGP